MTAPKNIAFKRGSTFAVDVVFTPTPGSVATDLTYFEIASEVRKRGELVATLTLEKAADNMGFRATAPEGTAAWPYGDLEWDIRFSLGGVIYYTETVGLTVLKEVTQCS